MLVSSCCNKSGTIYYHLVTRLMTVTDLLQVVSIRLIQAVRNNLLRTCCHQLVNNLLRIVQTISDLLEELYWPVQLVPDLSTTGNTQTRP
jgi:hypothetical protein